MTITYKNYVPPFEVQHLEAIARVLGDTNEGLTGREINNLLRDSKIPNVSPVATKWERIYNAFAAFQNEHQVGNHVVVFIKHAMHPASYTDCPDVFRKTKDRLNTVLALCGMQLTDGGEVRRVDKAKTLDEAMERADRLQAMLKARQVHADVLEHCNAEILQKNYFHAVEEAIKSITTKIRRLSGLTNDGAQLVRDAFELGRNNTPLLALSTLDTDTLRGEQRGFVSLLIGLYGTIRNPLAHNAKIEWDMNEQDALDILTMISLIHRKLDKARRYSPTT